MLLHANTPGATRCYYRTACKHDRRCQTLLQHCMQARQALPDVTACKHARRCQTLLQHCMQTRQALPDVIAELHANTIGAARRSASSKGGQCPPEIVLCTQRLTRSHKLMETKFTMTGAARLSCRPIISVYIK